MELTFITKNENKFREVRKILGIELLQSDLDLKEIQSVNAEEIIEEKLKCGFENLKKPIIVEDTALHFYALNGLPGALIKWFLTKLGAEGCYKLLETFEDKSAKAVCVVGYTKNGKDLKIFKGEVEGVIAEPRGSNGFGWDKIFIPKNYKMRYAEMHEDEKNRISHRGIAFKKLKIYLENEKSGCLGNI